MTQCLALTAVRGAGVGQVSTLTGERGAMTQVKRAQVNEEW
jgi:hypothetical protein